MKKSQLISVLGSLSKPEIREFRKWLLSPVHNQREDVVQLFDYLMTGNHLNDDKFLEKERIYRKIFGKEAYNDAKLRQTNHFLFKAVEEYFNFQDNEKDEIKTKITLIKNYRRRNLSKMVNKNLVQVENLLQDANFKNETFHRNDYEFQQEKYNYLSQLPNTSVLNLQAISNSLDKTYIIEKLLWSCRIIFHQILFRTKYDLGLLDFVLQKIEKDNLTREPAIAIYYYILKAITDKEDDHAYFEKLRSEINEFRTLFPHPQLREIYLMAINYCVRKMNAGIEAFERETFEWYRQGIYNEVLIEMGKLSPTTFTNTVTTAIKVGEFEWAEEFIDKYESMLPEKERENLSHFTRGKLYFEKKDYKRAMVLLAQAEYNNILYNLNAKSILIKMYYEQDEVDALDSLLDSMRIFIRRKDVIGYHRNRYISLIKFTKKLLRINPYNKEKMARLRNEIETANPPERQWLLEQLERF